MTISETQQVCETFDYIQYKNHTRGFPNFANSTTSKTKQFCRRRCRVSKLEICLLSWGLRANACCHFSTPFVYGIVPSSDARSYEALHPPHKIISASLKIWCLPKWNPFQEVSLNHHPDLPTSLGTMSLAQGLPRDMRLRIFSSHAPTLAMVFENVSKPCILLSRIPCACPNHTCTFKNIQEWSDHLNILTWKCVSCHNVPHFSNISVSKTGPRRVCFRHFGFELFFASQQRSFFRLLK